MAKKAYGANTQAPLSREQVENQYNYHVSQLGHKTTTLRVLEEEIVEHASRAHELRKLAAKLPPQSNEKPTAAPQTDPVETQTEEKSA